MLAQTLLAVSAAIMLILGVLHLHGTFFGPDLRPRDPVLEARMQEVAPGETGDTTMWNCWIAFNAAASLGFILFGVLYGYLAVLQFNVLLQAKFLLLVGAVFLISLLVVVKRYLFRTPVVAFGVCFVLYAGGTVTALLVA